MLYVRVPREITTHELSASDFCFSPGRYVRFIPPPTISGRDFVSLDRLVKIRDGIVQAKKGDFYRYAEIGDIDVSTGGINFRRLRGYQLPTPRPAVAHHGDVLISTVRTYRKGVGYVAADGDDLVTTNAVVNLCATSDEFAHLTLPYVYAFLRTDFFVEQVWSLLHRGVYPRMDTGALHQILLPVARDQNLVTYVAKLALAIVERENTIRTRHQAGVATIGRELDAGKASALQYCYPTSKGILGAARMDAGFWSPSLRTQIHRLKHYRRGAWSSIYDAGFTTRRGQNLQISAVGQGYYFDKPVGTALPLATPGDISDHMTIPHFRYYGNPRMLDTVRHGEVIFAAKGVREVSIGHTWVNLGTEPFLTNIDAFLIHSPSPVRNICLAFLFSYLKQVGVFAKLADTSNGGSFVQNYFDALPVPKFDEEFLEGVARFYHSPAPAPNKEITLGNFVEWHREWNENLGIWELDRELKSLQLTLCAVQEKIIEGSSIKLPFTETTTHDVAGGQQVPRRAKGQNA